MALHISLAKANCLLRLTFHSQRSAILPYAQMKNEKYLSKCLMTKHITIMFDFFPNKSWVTHMYITCLKWNNIILLKLNYFCENFTILCTTSIAL